MGVWCFIQAPHSLCVQLLRFSEKHLRSQDVMSSGYFDLTPHTDCPGLLALLQGIKRLSMHMLKL